MKQFRPLVQVATALALSAATLLTGAAVASAATSRPLVISHTVHPVVVGTVTVVTPSSGTPTSFVVQPLNAAAPTVNVTLGAATVVELGSSIVTATSLAVGERVTVHFTGTPAVASEVTIAVPAPIHVNGVVVALTPSSGTPTSFTVQPFLAGSSPVTVNLSLTTTFTLSGSAATVAALALGDRVWSVGTGSPVTATAVALAPPLPVHLTGVVASLTPSSGTPTSLTLTTPAPHSVLVSVPLSPTATYTQGGVTTTAAQLLVGSRVWITETGYPSTATTVVIAVPVPTKVVGTVTTLIPSSGTPTSFVVQPSGSASPVTVVIGGSTVFRQGGVVVTVGNLLVGSHVELLATGSPLTATTVHIDVPPMVHVSGSVTAIVGNTVTVQPATTGSLPVTFTVTPTTTFFEGHGTASLATVMVGDLVKVDATVSAPTTALSITVMNTALVGKVTGVAGNVITMTAFDGTVLTVTVSSTTVYRSAGAASSLAAVVPGVYVVAIGPAMVGVTTSVTATKVVIGVLKNPDYENAFEQWMDRLLRHHL